MRFRLFSCPCPAFLILALAVLVPGLSPGFGFSDAVRPIDWKRFTEPFPATPNALLEKDGLDRATKYYTTTWYNTTKDYDSQKTPYLDFKGVGEREIRPPAAVAFSEAIALSLGIYNPAFTGVERGQAMTQCKRLLTSLAYRHLANTPGGWGNVWQSALWAAYVGTAGWLLWDSLSVPERESIRKMVVYEAGRFKDAEPAYASRLNTLASDTKAEENAWNVGLIGLAVAMMPDHQDAPKWKYRLCQWSISAYARPSDDSSNAMVVNGKPVKDWISGYNVMQDGLLYNHGIMHPDYIASMQHMNINAAILNLAHMPAPRACLFNFDVMYSVLVEYKFDPAKGFLPPGGTIYREGTDTVYWPKGTDWGKDRRAHFALMDAQASVFGSDAKLARKGAYWENLHVRKLKAMQDRHADGHTYATPQEDTYAGREEWVAAHGVAVACLTHWIGAQPDFALTNESYETLSVSVKGATRNAVLVRPEAERMGVFDIRGVRRPQATGRSLYDRGMPLRIGPDHLRIGFQAGRDRDWVRP